MTPQYTPTTEDIAFCSAFDFHWQPEQRHAIYARAAQICPDVRATAGAEIEAAWLWLLAEDQTPGSTLFDDLMRDYPRYDPCRSPNHTGALGYLCELVDARANRNARDLRLVELWQVRA